MEGLSVDRAHGPVPGPAGCLPRLDLGRAASPLAARLFRLTAGSLQGSRPYLLNRRLAIIFEEGTPGPSFFSHSTRSCCLGYSSPPVFSRTCGSIIRLSTAWINGISIYSSFNHSFVIMPGQRMVSEAGPAGFGRAYG